MRILILAMLALSLVACADVSPQKQGPQSDLAMGLQDGGCVTIVVGQQLHSADRSVYQFHSIIYRRDGSHDTGRFLQTHAGAGNDTPTDVKSEAIRASLLRVCLQPGLYHVNGVKFDLISSYSEKSARNKEPIDLHFEVRQGEELYLGRCIAHGIWGKNFIGLPLPVSAIFVCEDGGSEDLALLKKLHPDAGAPITRLLIKDSSASPYFVPAADYRMEMSRAE